MLTTKISVGELDRRITIQEPVYENNDHNEDEITGWTDVVTLWAKAEQRQGSEVIDADRVTYYETTIFTVRHKTDLNVRMRVIFDSAPYRIFSITEHKASRKGYMEITAEVIDNEVVDVEGFEFTEEFTEEFNS